VPITESPFLIGRAGAGNHLQLADLRISRKCAAIRTEAGKLILDDRGQQGGVLINGKKIEQHVLHDGDVITFGLTDACEIIFRSGTADTSLPNMLNRISAASATGSSPGGLGKLNLLLEATRLLHSQLPLDAVLGAMLDYAITVTHADRGLLLEADASGALSGRVARRSGGVPLPAESISPSQTALRQALDQNSTVITEDLAHADFDLQAAQSIVAQQLRAVVAVPLYARTHADPSRPDMAPDRGDFLGVLYLDSRRPAAFSTLDREILAALATEAASILDNARLVERERERERLAQELRIARDIQQALLPRDFRKFPHVAVNGINLPSLTAAGDYFDVFALDADHTAFLIADVSGKGLGAALLTTIVQGALLGLAVGATAPGIFRTLNRFLLAHAEVDRYATMFFGILDRQGGLEFINGGHPSPLLLRQGQVSQPFTEGSFPVGLMPEADYESVHFQLQPGDTVVLFSDGVSEAANLEEEMFGIQGLRNAVAGHDATPLDQLQERIREALSAFTRGTTQADDITVLLVRYLGANPSAAPVP
jgi:serine phosphatase RsbU (regulator of sigma subunit)